MNFDPDNHIVKLCAAGMQKEGEMKTQEAKDLFMQAWREASNDFEKFIAAHYVARHQDSVRDKLKWDECALAHALKVDDEAMKANLPSLYLNIAKCYEDLDEPALAREACLNAQVFVSSLPHDGYGNMIRSGIASAIERLSAI